MVPSYVVTLFAVCGYLSTIDATSVDLACAANGGECGTTVTGLYCKVADLKCKCGDIYAAGTAGDTTCTAKTCTADSDCGTDECYKGTCRCLPGYTPQNADNGAGCVLTSLNNEACSDATVDCTHIRGAYCSSSTNKCVCGAIYDTATASDTSCVAKTCTAAVSGTDLCTTADPNAECWGKKCRCKDGYDIFGSSGLCVTTSGGMAVMYSASVLIVGVVAAFLRM